MGLEEFWHSTPGETTAYLDAASERAAEAMDAAKFAAYCIEVMARQDKGKRLMPLARWLERKSSEPQSPENQLAMMRAWVAASHGTKKAKAAKRG